MKQIKSYPINSSPLYKLSNKTKLAELLGIERKDLLHFKYTRDNYNCWKRAKKNGNEKRPVEDPKYELKKIQSKLNKLLSRVITSEYLTSGKKHLSYIDNAQYHQNNPYIFCFDLHSFFQTAKRKYVFKAFVDKFKMSDDIAWLITDLVTIPKEDNSEGYIPTGSPSSQIVIYWAYKSTFDKIFSIAEQKKLKFSLYVDDMTFSSENPITINFPKLIIKLCAKVGLEITNKKTKYFSKKQYKDVTGCITTPRQELKVPNKRRKEILDIVKNKSIENMTVTEIRSFYGKLNSMRQIEPNIFPTLYNRAKRQYYKLGAQYSNKPKGEFHD